MASTTTPSSTPRLRRLALAIRDDIQISLDRNSTTTTTSNNNFVRLSSHQLARSFLRGVVGWGDQSEDGGGVGCGGWKIPSSLLDDDYNDDDKKIVSNLNFLPLKIEVPYQADDVAEEEKEVTVLYASYNGGLCREVAPKVDTIEIPKSLVHDLQYLHDKKTASATSVSVSVLPFVPHATRILMEPLSTESWELLEVHGEFMQQGAFLSQLSLVYPNQKLTLHVGNDRVEMIVKEVSADGTTSTEVSTSVWPKLVNEVGGGDTDPSLAAVIDKPVCVLLVQNTEVIVSPKPRQSKESTSWTTPFRLIPSDEDWGEARKNILPLYSDMNPLQVDPGSILVPNDEWNVGCDWALVKASSDQAGEATCKRDALIRVETSTQIPSKCAVLPLGTRWDLGLSTWFDSVRLQPLWNPIEVDAGSVVLRKMKVTCNDETGNGSSAWSLPDINLSRSAFRENGVGNSQRLPNSFPLGATIFFDPMVPGLGENRLPSPDFYRIISADDVISTPGYVVLGEDNLARLSKTILRENEHQIEDPIRIPILESQCIWGPQETVSSSSWVRRMLGTMTNAASTILALHGQRGNGKTHNALLLSAVASFESHRPILYLDCKKLCKSNPQMVGLLGEMDSFFRRAMKTGHVIVVLDDIDRLAPNILGEDGGDLSARMQTTNPIAFDQSKLLANRLSDWMEALVGAERNDGEQTRVSIVVTCTAIESVYPTVLQSTSFGLETSKLPSVSPRDRMEILAKMIHRQCHEAAMTRSDLRDFEQRTEGYFPRDLEKISLRVGHVLESIAATNQSICTHDVCDCLAASLSDYTPLTQLAVQSSKANTGVQWSDIGGLFRVKQALESAIVHPIRFRRIYEKSPVRLPRGILLFGEGGCGKSYIVPALARHCNFPLITCRGPEVLDKYIGASEAKVRQLFERASQVAPSILFLDELDALAPKRGSDSTGVTDRVVNQLLTYLDGVEDTSSGMVYIIGATSRPDKIDPALIRPGRLEQHMYVGPPETPEEWRDLIWKVSRRWSLSAELSENLSNSNQILDIVNAIPRLCPADIGAAFDTAHLNAVHSVLKASADTEPDSVTIFTEDLFLGLRETRPSLREADAMSLHTIYRQFRGLRDEAGSSRAPQEPLKTSLR